MTCLQALQKKASSSHVRVFEESDFPRIAPEDCGLPHTQFLAYKRSKVGQPIPEQCVTDERLREAGYTSWLEYCVETPMLNWG